MPRSPFRSDLSETHCRHGNTLWAVALPWVSLVARELGV
jgi:hypothetical protein